VERWVRYVRVCLNTARWRTLPRSPWVLEACRSRRRLWTWRRLGWRWSRLGAQAQGATRVHNRLRDLPETYRNSSLWRKRRPGRRRRRRRRPGRRRRRRVGRLLRRPRYRNPRIPLYCRPRAPRRGSRWPQAWIVMGPVRLLRLRRFLYPAPNPFRVTQSRLHGPGNLARWSHASGYGLCTWRRASP
jgi:hypothetical protein